MATYCILSALQLRVFSNLSIEDEGLFKACLPCKLCNYSSDTSHCDCGQNVAIQEANGATKGQALEKCCYNAFPLSKLEADGHETQPNVQCR